jgi:hypothetical protein
LYLLTDVNTPFVQDGIREGEAIREWMRARFREELSLSGLRYAAITGDRERRLSVALDHARHLLNQPFDFARANAAEES